MTRYQRAVVVLTIFGTVWLGMHTVERLGDKVSTLDSALDEVPSGLLWLKKRPSVHSELSLLGVYVLFAAGGAGALVSWFFRTRQ